MNRKILYALTLFVVILVMTITVFAVQAEAPAYGAISTTISEADIPSEPSEPLVEEEVIVLELVEFERVEPTNLEEAEAAYEKALARNVAAFNAYNSLIDLDYPEDHPAVTMVLAIIEETEQDCVYYEDTLKTFQKAEAWRQRIEEYPVASQVWLYMQNEFGWNDIVCAGIMGNLMAECGGCWTSDLHYDINSSNGFGMIQWIGGRKNQLFATYGSNPGIEDQLNFMKDELYGTNGVTKQVTESQLNEIMNASTPEECAYAFAAYFERCATQHRAPRRDYARTAYNYFVD